MSSSNLKNTQNKNRLGRGLGSLLSTNASDFETKVEPKVIQKPEIKPFLAGQNQQNDNNIKTNHPLPSVEKAVAPVITAQKIESVPEKQSPERDLSTSNRIWSLAIEKVVANQSQPRKDFLKEPLEELAASIREQGVLQPITVRQIEGRYEIIAGERRWRASQLAGLSEIPAIVKNVDDQKAMELALIENLQRENLNPLEEAMGYQLLIDEYGLSQQSVADKVGKNRATVTNALRVLTLPREVKEMLRQGVLSVGHAKVLLSLDNPKLQSKLARKVSLKKLSVRALEKELKKLDREKLDTATDSVMNSKERMIKNLSDEIQKALGTKVQLLYRQGRGKIEISFYSDDELTSLSQKLKSVAHFKK